MMNPRAVAHCMMKGCIYKKGERIKRLFSRRTRKSLKILSNPILEDTASWSPASPDELVRLLLHSRDGKSGDDFVVFRSFLRESKHIVKVI